MSSLKIWVVHYEHIAFLISIQSDLIRHDLNADLQIPKEDGQSRRLSQQPGLPVEDSDAAVFHLIDARAKCALN